MFRNERRCIEGFLQPGEQIPVGKENQAQDAGEVGEGETGFGEEVEPPEQQKGDQCCPNLDAHCVFTGSHEGLHLQVLLERFEKQLYLPPVLVNRRDGRRTEIEVIGEQVDVSILLLVPNRDDPQQMLALLAGVSRQADNAVL